MVLPILGLLAGLGLGYIFPVVIPFAYAKLFSVALLASLDAVFGGLKASTTGTFDSTVFISGFFLNALMAAFLVFIGDRLGIDLYYVALLALGFRIFKNLAILRRNLFNRHNKGLPQGIEPMI